MLPFPRLRAAVLASCLLVICPLLSARIISINVASGTSGTTAIDGAEMFGVPELGTVVGNWNNINGSASLRRSDGSLSAVAVTLVAPGGYNFYGAPYVNTPLNYGQQHYAATAKGTGLTFQGLQREFPTGFLAIVYLTGFVSNTGASVTDGSTTFYYQTANPLPASFAPTDLIRTTLTTAPAAGQAPVAHYAVFGSSDAPLTADTIQFSIDLLSGGGAGFGGVQLVAVGDAPGGGDTDQTWTDPALGTYFLDAAQGSDSNDGRSPETAWQTLGKLNTVSLAAGDVILFKAGSVFTGSFEVFNSGSPDRPIVFGAYGTGPKPRLQGGASDREVVFMTNNQWIEMRDLEISNYHPGGTINHRFGIRIIAPPRSGEMRQLHFHRLDFIGIMGSDPEHESRAIYAETTTNDEARPQSWWNGFVIENCFFSNIDGRAVQLRDFSGSLADFKIRALPYAPTVGFVFQNNTGQTIYRNLLQLIGTKGAVVQHNYMSGTTHGSAFWPFDAEGTLVQFNDFRHMRNPEADSYICHFDYNCIDTVMQYNFGYDVDGGLIEIIVLSQFSFFQEDAIARYNVGVDVGFRTRDNAAGIMLTGRVTRSWVYNNTIVNTALRPAYKALAINDWGGEWPTANFVHNNLFLATGNPVTFKDAWRMAELGNVMSHNLYWGNISVPPGDSAPLNANPLLVNPAGLDPADFKLHAGSPAIAAGIPIANNGGRDFFGNPLPADLIPSIGFHEFQTEGWGRWAGYETDTLGFVDTGRGFLGVLWVGYDSRGAADWRHSPALGWLYVPTANVVLGDAAWIYAPDLALLDATDIHGAWFFSAALDTWCALPAGQTVSGGAAWVLVPDLSSER
jgi:hypothetical protein